MKMRGKLNALREEVETVSRKQHELTEEELIQVTGGGEPFVEPTDSTKNESIQLLDPLPETPFF